MLIELLFSNSIVSGSGVDDIAAFTWTGKYDIDAFKISMTKHYSTHKVLYRGAIDENGIWGVWEIECDIPIFSQALLESIKAAFKNDLTGGFHIWPKKRAQETGSSSQEEQAESERLKKIFIETFA